MPDMDFSGVAPAPQPTPSHIGDIEVQMLVDLGSHEAFRNVPRRDNAGNQLYDDGDGGETTENRRWVSLPTEEDPGAGKWEPNTPLEDQVTVTFGGVEQQKFNVGGGVFTVPFIDTDGHVYNRVQVRTGQLPEWAQLALLKVAQFVRWKASTDTGVAPRQPDATVAPYVQAVYDMVEAENA